MGFVDQSGTPTAAYRLLKGHERRGAIAEGIKRAYAPLFDSDQEAQKLPPDRLKSLIGQVAGVDADATARIASTFLALAKLADFENSVSAAPAAEKTEPVAPSETEEGTTELPKGRGLRTEFHYNLQIHLPANGSEETYLNIFNAIRKTFQ